MGRLVFLLGVWVWAGSLWAQDLAGLAHFEGGGFSDRLFGGSTLDLDLSQPVVWRVFMLEKPRRLVVDFRELDWRNVQGAQLDQSRYVSSVHVGRLQPGWSRLVAELSVPLAVREAGLRIDEQSGTARFSLRLDRISKEEFAERAGPPVVVDGWDIPSEPVMRVRVPRPDGAKLLVMLDPGHGGIDPGAQADGADEADLVLQFAKEFREVLLRTGRYEVALTREEDVFVSLQGRVALAHEAGTDLFISLHADALAEGRAHGASVYTLAGKASDPASAALAALHDRGEVIAGFDLSNTDDQVAQVLLDLVRQDSAPRSGSLAGHLVAGIRNALGHVHKRPLRQAEFGVLKSPHMPSVLVELGFLTSRQDLDNLRDPIWRAAMAAGLRDGIDAWAEEDAVLKGLRRH